MSCYFAQDCRTLQHWEPKWTILCKQTCRLGNVLSYALLMTSFPSGVNVFVLFLLFSLLCVYVWRWACVQVCMWTSDDNFQVPALSVHNRMWESKLRHHSYRASSFTSWAVLLAWTFKPLFHFPYNSKEKFNLTDFLFKKMRGESILCEWLCSRNNSLFIHKLKMYLEMKVCTNLIFK